MPPIAPDSPKLRGMRERLAVELREAGIMDSHVLAAIAKVRRHAFVESAFADKAYQDIPLPIGVGQTISQPYTVAYMTALLGIQRGNKILEIGTGSGYQAAILAELGAEVCSIERQRELVTPAKSVLLALGYNIRLKVGDGTLGWPMHAPYQGIIVTAGGPTVPAALQQQLAVGGKLVIPVGDRESQRLVCVTRTGAETFDTKTYHDFRFVPLIGQQGWGQ